MNSAHQDLIEDGEKVSPSLEGDAINKQPCYPTRLASLRIA